MLSLVLGIIIRGFEILFYVDTKIIVTKFATTKLIVYVCTKLIVDTISMEIHKATPTTAELEILTILWENEPLTVKEIHEKLIESKDIGYTTALKIMQNMTIKGLLRREPNGKNHLYYSVFKKEETRGKLLDRFLESTFSGSASNLVMQLLGNKKTSQKDLDEIKKIIAQMEKNQQNPS